MKSENSTDTLFDDGHRPDSDGHFGEFGGKYVSETLMAALDDLNIAWQKLRKDKDFIQEFDQDLSQYVGRPSPLYHAKRNGRNQVCLA